METLSTASKDSLEHLKDKAMKASKVLLAAKPEQERALLRALVNKLGDPVRKVRLPSLPVAAPAHKARFAQTARARETAAGCRPLWG